MTATASASHPILGVDHTYVLVKDLDRAEAQYRRLGFTLSPRGFHSPHMGTANHTIVFAEDYFELLGIVAETPRNAPQRQLLAEEGERLQAIANRTASADAAKRELAALGIASGDVAAFSRPVPLAEGGEGAASFRTLNIDRAHVPFGQFFLCQHETPALVWQESLKVHANGARRLARIVATAEDPQGAATRLAALYRDGRVVPDADGYRVDTGANSAPILVLPPEAAQARYGSPGAEAVREGYVALGIEVASLEHVARHFASEGVPPLSRGDAVLVVDAAHAGGVAIEFVEAPVAG